MSKFSYVLLDLILLRGLRFIIFYIISGFDLSLAVDVMYFEVVSFITRGLLNSTWKDKGYQSMDINVDAKVNIFLLIIVMIIFSYSVINALAILFGILASHYDSLVFNKLKKSLILSKIYESVPLIVHLLSILLLISFGIQLDIQTYFVLKLIIPFAVGLYYFNLEFSVRINSGNEKFLLSGILFFILITFDRRIYSAFVGDDNLSRVYVILVYMSSVIVTLGRLLSDILFTSKYQKKVSLEYLIIIGVTCNIVGLVMGNTAIQVVGNGVILSTISINRHMMVRLLSFTNIILSIISFLVLYFIAVTSSLPLNYSLLFSMLIIVYVAYNILKSSSQQSEAKIC